MLKEIKKGENPYPQNTCEYAVYHTLAYVFTIYDTIKISSVVTKCVWKNFKDGKQKPYNKKTIGQALLKLESDGYLKTESQNAVGEKIYIKKGQLKNEN